MSYNPNFPLLYLVPMYGKDNFPLIILTYVVNVCIDFLIRGFMSRILYLCLILEFLGPPPKGTSSGMQEGWGRVLTSFCL